MTNAQEYFAKLLEGSGQSVKAQPQAEQKQPQPLKPWDVYEKLKELEPNIGKGQTLKEARVMIDQGYTLEEIMSCAHALMKDEWRRSKGIPLNATAISKSIRAHTEATGSKWTPL